MVTEVLKEDDGSGFGVSAGGLHFLADAVVEEKYFPKNKEKFFELFNLENC